MRATVAAAATDVRKSYGGVVALRDVDFAVEAGTVHALLGENGADKSTLVKALVGAVGPDTGTVRRDGVPVRFGSSAEAARQGVAVVRVGIRLPGRVWLPVNLAATTAMRGVTALWASSRATTRSSTWCRNRRCFGCGGGRTAD